MTKNKTNMTINDCLTFADKFKIEMMTDDGLKEWQIILIMLADEVRKFHKLEEKLESKNLDLSIENLTLSTENQVQRMQICHLESMIKNKKFTTIQPVIIDYLGIARFKSNEIVQYLLDTHPTCDMNHIAMLNFTDKDRAQFAQLIGYSIGGYGELSYSDTDEYETAMLQAKEMLKEHIK